MGPLQGRLRLGYNHTILFKAATPLEHMPSGKIANTSAATSGRSKENEALQNPEPHCTTENAPEVRRRSREQKRAVALMEGRQYSLCFLEASFHHGVRVV